MEQSKIIGKLILLTGLGMSAFGAGTSQGVFVAIGSLVILAGRLVDEYWDDWFGA